MLLRVLVKTRLRSIWFSLAGSHKKTPSNDGDRNVVIKGSQHAPPTPALPDVLRYGLGDSSHEWSIGSLTLTKQLRRLCLLGRELVVADPIDEQLNAICAEELLATDLCSDKHGVTPQRRYHLACQWYPMSWTPTHGIHAQARRS